MATLAGAMNGPGADRLSALPWEQTPLGPRADWPGSLCAAIDLMLGAGAPGALFIGPQLVQMHNLAFDALYRDGSAATRALGRSLKRDDPDSSLAKAAGEVFAGRSILLASQGWTIGASPGTPAFNLSCAPIRDESGQVGAMLVLAFPVTSPARLDAGASISELQHRVRNLLAVVRSLVARSAESSDTVEDLAAHLDGRIAAVARVHGVLLRNPHAGVDLEGMIRDELLTQSADQDRLNLGGPEIVLPPKAADLMTLAIHELATNATKFGALSQASGKLDITWKLDQAGARGQQLELVWMESGVAIASQAPRRQGFGTNLLKRRLPYELAGEADIEFRPGGVVCRIAFPLAPVAAMGSSSVGGVTTTAGDDA